MKQSAGLTAVLLLPLAGGAAAHPLHEVVQAAYLTLLPGETRLQLDMDAWRRGGGGPPAIA